MWLNAKHNMSQNASLQFLIYDQNALTCVLIVTYNTVIVLCVIQPQTATKS